MPDFKFEFITHESPWKLHEIGLAEEGDEGSFYTLSTGHDPVGIAITENRVLFRAEINVDESNIASAQDYLDLLRLQNIELSNENHEDPLAVTDVQMAEYLNGPAVWTESNGEIVEITIDDEPVTVPHQFIIYEMIPFEQGVQTMTALKEELSNISNSNDIWITLS